MIAIPVALVVTHLTPALSAGAVAAPAPRLATGVAHSTWFDLNLADGGPTFTTSSTPQLPAPPAISAAGGILVDIDTGRILWEHNPHLSLAPASTTKIMTALLTLENLSPDTVITVTPDALNQAGDETKVGLRAGEKLTVRELMYAMLMESANDAATVLANDTVGHDRFVGAMNAQVAALGLHDSHFVTSVGLDDPGQRASAYDLAVLGTVVETRFPLMQQITSTTETILPATATHRQYNLYNLNQLLQMFPGAVGIKPGYTGDAGPCEVGMAVRNGHHLVSVLLNAAYAFKQTSQLLDWGFRVDVTPTASATPTH